MSKKKKKMEKKRAVVTQKDKKNSAAIMIAAAIILAASIAGVSLFLSKNNKYAVTDGSGQSEEIATQITYPLSLFDDGKAVHFDYTDNGVTVKYFVIKSSDGAIRAAFDACDVCWPAGKGYYQDGDDMVCRNCGRRFPSVRINEVEGGCNPAPLTRNIAGDFLHIRVDDILEGRKYFDFSKI